MKRIYLAIVAVFISALAERRPPALGYLQLAYAVDRYQGTALLCELGAEVQFAQGQRFEDADHDGTG